MIKPHSFHIPVMGIGFTIDSPLKVAQYGIDSVISLVDDILLEKLRKMYSEKFEIPYVEISKNIDDFRAKRITSYLNLIHKQTVKQFEELKNVTIQKNEAIKTYMSMLPDYSRVKKEFEILTQTSFDFSKIRQWANKNLTMGSIDVNIMSKLDKSNYKNKEELPVEFNDAHAALRGYANSNLCSSLIISAGMNPKLYAYLSQFDDFFPDKTGFIKKKIVLKVSDYRSALIQGKFLAKKGIWVSEYRIESGLNCGGHAFATDGYLLGPILEQFKKNGTELVSELQELLNKALLEQNRIIPEKKLSIKTTAQGGVGTKEEQSFLLDYYNMDSIGWGSPFLLVPEATTVDKETLHQLAKAKEKDLYLSNISPLGVPFNNLLNNTKDIEKQKFIDKNRPGSSCPNKFIALNKEFKDSGTCTASREYQFLKIKELDTLNLPPEEYALKYNKIVEKSCICIGLGTSALLSHNLDTKVEGTGVSVCPGPNIAYFSEKMSLKNITDHIYGRTNVITQKNRPNMFIKELNIYIKYLTNKLEEEEAGTEKQKKYLRKFENNLRDGIAYYTNLFKNSYYFFRNEKHTIINDLANSKLVLDNISTRIQNL